MKISHMSDIHADFHVPFTCNQLKWRERTKTFAQQLIETDEGEHEVMVIAGDISHFNIQSFWIIEEFAKAYEQVFYCMGNHDFYLVSKNQETKYKGHSLNRMQELLALTCDTYKNVIPLIGFQKHNITEDITIAGDTFWYPLEELDDILFFHNVSNDSQLIKRMFIGLEHNYSMTNYNNLDQATIIVTHVPPITTESHHFYNSTACYLNPIRDLKSNHWIFGHVHEQSYIQKPYGNFYVNALGYENDWKKFITVDDLRFSDDWKKIKKQWFSIKHFEV